jgi:hypothetical protein
MTGEQPWTFLATRGVRQAYLVGSLFMIAAYVALPTTTGRNIAFLVVSLSALPGVILVLRGIEPEERRPWQLLFAALILLNLGNAASLIPGEFAFTVGTLLEPAGDLFLLAATLSVVTRHRNRSFGSVRGQAGRTCDTWYSRCLGLSRFPPKGCQTLAGTPWVDCDLVAGPARGGGTARPAPGTAARDAWPPSSLTCAVPVIRSDTESGSSGRLHRRRVNDWSAAGAW